MAFDAFTIVKFVHVLGAMALVGALAALPMMRARAAGDPQLARPTLGAMQDLQTRLALPSVILLIATGLAMVYGPAARYDLLRHRWTLSGLLISLILLVILVGSLGGSTRKLLAAHAAPAAPADDASAAAPPAPASDVGKLWADWRTAVIAAALLAVLATALMVFRPGM